MSKTCKNTGNVHKLNLGPAKMRGRGVYLSHFQLVPMGTNCRIFKIGVGTLISHANTVSTQGSGWVPTLSTLTPPPPCLDYSKPKLQ